MAESNINNVIEYDIPDNHKLYLSYLPYVKNGAIFIPSKQRVSLGDTFKVSISLLGSSERQNFQGGVVWINHRTQGNRPSGFAVQLSNDKNGLAIKSEIERMLAGMTGSLQTTYTV